MTESISAGTGRASLKRSTIFFYGLVDLPVMMALIPISVYVHNYYTIDLKIDLVLMANLLLVSRILDWATDPLIGYLSDRTRSRWGRRRPWIAASIPVLMLGIYKLFFPDPGADVWYLFIWMSVFWLGWTMLLIPYYAWAAELTPDYQERTIVTGWRSIFGAAGQLTAVVAPSAILYFIGFGGTGEVLEIVGVLLLIVLPAFAAVTLTQVKERRDFVPSVIPFWKGLALMWRNGPFKRLIVSLWLGYTALALATAMFLYYVRIVVQEEKEAVYALALFYLCNLVAVSFWVWLSRRIGKHRAWIASFVLIACVNPLYLLHGPGDFYWMLPIMGVSGFAAGAFAALPNSMKADVVDIDTLRSGEDRAALYFSSWSFVQKAAATVAGWLALMGLALVGFEPSLGASPEQPVWGIKILFGVVPSLFYLAAAVVAWNYPITEVRHRKLREQLEARRARRLAAAAAVAE